MVFFVTGGQTMRRPYISSSNYIFKMSDYNKITWYNYDKWNDLYHIFIKKNKEKLKKFGYYIKT
jgi:deoxyribodipyrimidine photolyase-related protein